MTQPTESYKQFNYTLRPSKQVERKIMIEVLLSLNGAGYEISRYTYVGFGSPYYADFVMFHKYLFMQRMVCVEWGDVKKRMRFNKPFKCIELRLEAFSTYIPRMRPTTKYLVWLDYDRSLDLEILQDIDGALNRVAPRSVLVITLDARPKLPKDQFDPTDKTAAESETVIAGAYREWVGRFTDNLITRDTVSRERVTTLFYEVVVERIRQTLVRRGGGLRFVQLFNYVYRDGAPMLTIGGMVGTDYDERQLEACGVLRHRFVRPTDDYLEISVPPLTFREKQWLDTRLDRNLTADRLRFELDPEVLENYRKFYTQYPTYMESFL